MTTTHNAQPARDNTPATNPRDIPRPHQTPAAFPVLTPNPRSLDHHHATTGSAQAAAHHHDTQHCQHHSSDHHTAAQQRDHDDHSSQHQPSRPAPQTTDTQRDQHAAHRNHSAAMRLGTAKTMMKQRSIINQISNPNQTANRPKKSDDRPMINHYQTDTHPWQVHLIPLNRLRPLGRSAPPAC